MQKNGGWQKCKMADYLYSVAIRANSFHNNMADKMVWRINQVQINEYSLCIYIYIYIYCIIFILTIKLMYIHKIICLYECLSMCVLCMHSDLHV